MLKRISFVLIALFLAMVAMSCGSEVKSSVPKTDKEAAESQSDFPGKVGKRPKDVRSVDYSDPQVCSGCHQEIFSQWSKSMHNSAYTDPIYRKFLALAKSETNGEFDEFCTACHTPIGFVTGETPPWEDSRLSEIAKKGNQCDFCHTVKKAAGIGNYQFMVAPGNVKRGPFKDAISPYHDTSYSELHTKPEFCAMCHNANHPKNGLPLEKTYTEWKQGPYAQKGVICQDCHMTPGPGVTKPNPGFAAVGGPKRSHIWTHFGIGGNVLVPTLNGSQEHARQAVERLQAAAVIAITTAPMNRVSQNTIKIKVTNTGAGHYIPTGLTEIREMWVDLKVSDSTGRVIYASGQLDGAGNIQDGSAIYRTIVADKSGEETHSVWFAEKIISDKRIPPKETVTETFSFAVPGDAVLPLGVEAVLKYRSAPQSLIDSLFGAGQVQVPVIEMTRSQATIQ